MVVKSKEPFRNIPETLNTISKDIEEEKYGKAKTVSVVLLTEEGAVEVFGLGKGGLRENKEMLKRGLEFLNGLEKGRKHGFQ